MTPPNAEVDGGAGQLLRGGPDDLGGVDSSTVNISTQASADVDALVIELADTDSSVGDIAATTDKAKGKFTTGDIVTAPSMLQRLTCPEEASP